jgi:hypothetical protein
MKNEILVLRLDMDGWMDGLKVGEIKSPYAGHKSGLMCTTQMKN